MNIREYVRVAYKWRVWWAPSPVLYWHMLSSLYITCMCTLWTKGAIFSLFLATSCIVRASRTFNVVQIYHQNTCVYTSVRVCVCPTHDSIVHMRAMSYASIRAPSPSPAWYLAYVPNDSHSFIFAPWLIQPYMCHDSFSPMHATPLIGLASYKVSKDSFNHVCHDWCLHMCVMTHLTLPSSLCVPRWFLRMCAKTDSAICAPPPYMHAHSHTHTYTHAPT